MKSILNTEKGICYMCGRHCPTEEHHIFFGAGNRALSEKYGLKVNLCHQCHNEPPNGVHHNAMRRQMLCEVGQTQAMEKYGWSTEDFMKLFGRNYL